MVLSPCRSLIQVAIILVFESVRLQPSFGQSGSMFKEQCLENPTFSWRFTFHLQRFCIIYLNPQAVIMPFLRCCTKGHTLETKILIGKFGTSWRICPYAATTRSVYRWWLPSGVICLRFILISIVQRSGLRTTFQSCVEIATMMSQKFLVFFFSAMRCAIVFISYFHLRRYALCSPSGIAICWCSHFAFCFRIQALCSSYAIATVAWLSRRDNRVCEGFLIQYHRHKHSQSLVRTVCFHTFLAFIFCFNSTSLFADYAQSS